MCAVASSTAITLKTIMIATDLSPASLRSLPYVTALAHQYGSTIYLANVTPLGLYGLARPESFGAIEAECQDYAQRELHGLAGGIQVQGISVQVLLTEGDVGVIIPNWIKQYKIDLLAVGTAGRGGLRKLLLGSVAEEMIREATCPVLAVGPGVAGEAPARARSILCATDFSPEAVRAGRYACSMACQDGARVIFLHVTDEATSQASYLSLAEQLHDLIPENLALSVEPEVLIAQGRPGAKILEIVDQHSAGLIALGVRGAGGFGRAASHFGSTAHEVVVGAHCPVLVVPS